MFATRHSSRRHPALVWLVVVAWLMVAHSALADNSTTTAATAELNATCSQINLGEASKCDIRNTCSRCWRTEGCEFDLSSRQCMVASLSSDPLSTVSSLTLSSPSIDFCADNDRYCSTCTVSMFQPVCTGNDGCTCRPRCSVMREYEVTCYLRSQSTMVYSSILVIGITLPMLMMIYKWWARRQGYDTEEIRAEVRRQLIQQARRQRRAARARPPSALSLQLDAWRTHREQTKNDIENVELANFYTLMENGGQSSPHDDAVNRPPPLPSSSVHASVESESKEEEHDDVVSTNTNDNINQTQPPVGLVVDAADTAISLSAARTTAQ